VSSREGGASAARFLKRQHNKKGNSMGHLKITADGSESVIVKDNTAMVAGANSVLTGGNFACVTAGVAENVVLGVLVTALLGGKLEVAAGRIVMDGTLTNLYGRKTDLGALNRRLDMIDQSITPVSHQVDATIQEVTALDTQVRSIKSDAATVSTSVDNISFADLTSHIRNLAMHTKMIAEATLTVIDQSTRFTNTTHVQRALHTKLTTVSESLTQTTFVG
jgi:hypothetical protein